VLNVRRKRPNEMGHVRVEEMNESEPIEDMSKVIRSYRNREWLLSLERVGDETCVNAPAGTGI
jgi:hypothetical protein